MERRHLLMKSKKNRNDFVLILVLLAVILIGFLVVRLQRQKDAFTVDVSVNGTTVATYRLDEEIDTWIDGYQGGQKSSGDSRWMCPDRRGRLPGQALCEAGNRFREWGIAGLPAE